MCVVARSTRDHFVAPEMNGNSRVVALYIYWYFLLLRTESQTKRTDHDFVVMYALVSCRSSTLPGKGTNDVNVRRSANSAVVVLVKTSVACHSSVCGRQAWSWRGAVVIARTVRGPATCAGKRPRARR